MDSVKVDATNLAWRIDETGACLDSEAWSLESALDPEHCLHNGPGAARSNSGTFKTMRAQKKKKLKCVLLLIMLRAAF